MAVDTSRPFPMLANKSLNIAVRLTNAENEEFFALVQVPSILPRFLELPTHEGRAFILLEKIIAMHLGELFELYNIKQYDPFRITEIPTLTLTRIPRILWLKLKSQSESVREENLFVLNSARNATEKFVNFLLTLSMLRSMKSTFREVLLTLHSFQNLPTSRAVRICALNQSFP